MTKQQFVTATLRLGLDDDCPLCGYAWPGCCGRCIEHEPVPGRMGPFHHEYNDDCPQCHPMMAKGGTR